MVFDLKFLYMPNEIWFPSCGLIFGSLNFQISVGAMAVVFDSMCMYWRNELNPAFIEKSEVKEYLNAKRYSGPLYVLITLPLPYSLLPILLDSSFGRPGAYVLTV